MPRDLTADDRIVLERLQNELACRADGALDTWSLICLGSDGLVIDRQGFLIQQIEIMRSHVVVLRAMLARFGMADTKPTHALLDAIAEACQQLGAAFLVLEQYRSVPLLEVNSAIQELARAYQQLKSSLKSLKNVVGNPSDNGQGQPPKQESYYQGILAGMFEQFRKAREAESVPV